jgi:hypothetical protein
VTSSISRLKVHRASHGELDALSCRDFINLETESASSSPCVALVINGNPYVLMFTFSHMLASRLQIEECDEDQVISIS